MNNETKNVNEIDHHIDRVDKEVNSTEKEFNSRISVLKEEINSLIVNINVGSENLSHDFNKLNFFKKEISNFLANLEESSSFNENEINFKNKLIKTLQLFFWRLENCEKKIQESLTESTNSHKENNLNINEEKFDLVNFNINAINVDNAWQLFDNYFDNPNINIVEDIDNIKGKLKTILEIILENNKKNFDVLEANVLKKIFSSKINVGKRVDFYNSLMFEVKKELKKRNQKTA